MDQALRAVHERSRPAGSTAGGSSCPLPPWLARTRSTGFSARNARLRGMTVLSLSTSKRPGGGGEGGAASTPIADVRFSWFLGQRPLLAYRREAVCQVPTKVDEQGQTRQRNPEPPEHSQYRMFAGMSRLRLCQPPI